MTKNKRKNISKAMINSSSELKYWDKAIQNHRDENYNDLTDNHKSSKVITVSYKYQTIKIWKTTLQKLRFLHAYTGEPMVEILDGLIEVELEKYQNSEVQK